MNYTINRAQIKENSKAQLGNNLFGNLWLMALLTLFIQSAIMGIAANLYVAPLILAGPLGIGVALVFLKLVRGENKVDLGDLFVSFSQRFGKDLLLGLMITIFTALWTMLFIVPGIVKSYAYSMAYFISLDNPDWDWRQCIDESNRITQGHKGELFVLDLSFIGWYIVGSLCLGVGALWVAPYHMTAKANYYEVLKSNAAPAQPYTAPVEPVQPMQ